MQFTGSAAREAAQTNRRLTQEAARFRQGQDGWFDGTPHSIDRRLAACNRVLTLARAAVARSPFDWAPTEIIAELEADHRALKGHKEELLNGYQDRVAFYPPDPPQHIDEKHKPAWREDVANGINPMERHLPDYYLPHKQGGPGGGPPQKPVYQSPRHGPTPWDHEADDWAVPSLEQDMTSGTSGYTPMQDPDYKSLMQNKGPMYAPKGPQPPPSSSGPKRPLPRGPQEDITLTDRRESSTGTTPSPAPDSGEEGAPEVKIPMANSYPATMPPTTPFTPPPGTTSWQPSDPNFNPPTPYELPRIAPTGSLDADEHRWATLEAPRFVRANLDAAHFHDELATRAQHWAQKVTSGFDHPGETTRLFVGSVIEAARAIPRPRVAKTAAHRPDLFDIDPEAMFL